MAGAEGKVGESGNEVANTAYSESHESNGHLASNIAES